MKCIPKLLLVFVVLLVAPLLEGRQSPTALDLPLFTPRDQQSANQLLIENQIRQRPEAALAQIRNPAIPRLSEEQTQAFQEINNIARDLARAQAIGSQVQVAEQQGMNENEQLARRVRNALEENLRLQEQLRQRQQAVPGAAPKNSLWRSSFASKMQSFFNYFRFRR